VIQIESIHIEEFRGIRNLDLTFGSTSFVIYGPNGSGKSGVVDAIDFALTGNIARLAGTGTGNLNLQRHGPHVHCRDNPAAAKVAMTVRDPTTGEQAVLRRSVNTARTCTLEPDTPAMRAAIERAQQHPELTLSRREIIKYILVEAGKRAEEVQTLLKLGRIDEIRKVFKTARSKTSSARDRTKSEENAAEEAMCRHLDLTELLNTEMAREVNSRRTTLGLDPLSAITLETDLRAGVDVEGFQQPFDKNSSLRDVQALSDRLTNTTALTTAVNDLRNVLEELADDPEILLSLQQHSFIDKGLQLVSENVCPLCDTEWENMEKLRTYLAEKLARSNAADVLQHRVQTVASSVVQELREVCELIRATQPHVANFGTAELPHRLQGWLDDLATFEAKLDTVESTVDQESRLAGDPLAIPPSMVAGLAALLETLRAKPGQTGPDRDFPSSGLSDHCSRALDPNPPCSSRSRKDCGGTGNGECRLSDVLRRSR